MSARISRAVLSYRFIFRKTLFPISGRAMHAPTMSRKNCDIGNVCPLRHFAKRNATSPVACATVEALNWITKNASGLLHSGAFLFVETNISADAMLFMLFSQILLFYLLRISEYPPRLKHQRLRHCLRRQLFSDHW